MANTILTVSQITRKALMILHQKANFIGSIDRQYDDSFAKDGAKIGDTLRIRLPNRYVTRTQNAVVLAPQDTVERQVSLVVSRRLGVDLNFTSTDLTLSLDDFSERILDPAMAALAAGLENDAMIGDSTYPGLVNSVFQQVNNQGNAIQFRHILLGRKLLQEALTPLDKRTVNLCPQDNVDLVDNLKGLFNDKTALSEQYLEGYMGRTAGFAFMENTLWPKQPRGSANTAYQVGAVAPVVGDTTLSLQAGSGSFAAGDIITIDNVFRIHPETRQSTGILMQFAVQTTTGGGAQTQVTSAPAMYWQSTGVNASRQNINAPPVQGASVKIAGAINTPYGQSLMYQKGAFTFATADLVMPNGVDFKAREVLDGISMRIIRQYDINNDAFPCRLDVQYGFVAQRPQLAVVLANN
jgi:hypothetical protein